MGTHIKTTLDIATPLLEQAKRLAAREHVTLRALIEEGLRAVLAAREHPAFRLRDARFRGKGRGLHPDFAPRGYADLRDAAYEHDDDRDIQPKTRRGRRS